MTEQAAPSPNVDHLPHVVAFGSPCGGFKLHGPFPDRKSADHFAEWLGEGGDFVMPIHPAAVEMAGPFKLYPWSE